MKKFILIGSLFMFVAGMHAQNKWTLRECINYAITHNIDVKKQGLAVKNAHVEVSTSKNSRLPNLNGSIDPGFAFGRVTNQLTNISEDNNIFSTSFGVNSSTPVFTGFRIPNQIKADQLNLSAAVEGLKKAMDNIELQVTSYYLEVLFKKEMLKVYEEQVLQTKEQVERTKMLVDGGKAPLSQLYDMKAQLAKDELSLTVGQNDLDLSVLNLMQALNLEEMAGFDVVAPYMEDVIAENISSIIPPDDIYQTAIGIKPHIKEAEYRIESRKSLVKVAQSGYWPTVNFNLGYTSGFTHIYKTGFNNSPIGRQIKNTNREAVGFSVAIPIFNRFSVRNAVRTAKLNVESSMLDLDDVKLKLYKEIQQAYQSAVSAQSKFASTEKSLASTKLSYDYATERYAIGKSTVFELNESKLKMVSSQSEQIQAKYDFLFRAKILDFYRGMKIDIK